MGFFAGKLGSKSVFSLDTRRGGSPNDHANPNGDTIFHSDMPFLFVEKRYRVNVRPEGDRGYFVGEMPAELANILSNDQDQVIIPVYVFIHDGREMRKQLMGRQENVGYNIFQADWVQSLAVTGSQHGSTFPDMQIEWGTWRRGGLNNLEAEIARQGTGGSMARISFGGDDYAPETNFYCAYGAAAAGPNNIPGWNRVTQRNWNPYNGWNAGGYKNIGRITMEMHNLLNPNWIGPLGPLGQGHNWVFIRPGGSRVHGWSKVGLGDTWNDWRFTHTYPDFYRPNYDYAQYLCQQMRGDFSHFGDSFQWDGGEWGPLLPMGFEYTYPIWPVAIEFLKLNLRTRGRQGGYVVTNPFQGNEIKISKNEFIIRNYDLRQTDMEMLIAISGGANDRLGWANSWFSTNNLLNGMGDIGDGGSLNLCGTRASDGVTETLVPNQGGSGAGYPGNVKMGFYKFPRNSSVEIDSRNNAIKLNGQDIWSGTHRPLHLWNGWQKNDVIIGHNYELIQCNEGQEIMLGEYDLGLNAGNHTNIIIMSMEYMAAGLHITGDKQFMKGAGLRWEGAGRRLSDDGYNRGDAFHHMFITLPSDVYVPIHARRTWSYFDANNTGEGKPRANLVYYLRKRGDNGRVQFWVRSWSKVGWINVPKYRVNLQKVV